MVFRVPKIKTCCCCMSLRTGGAIIAGLDTLGCIAILLLAEYHVSNKASFNQMLFYDTTFANIGVFSFLFLYAMIKKDHTLMFPWILQQSVGFLILLNQLLCSLVYVGTMSTRPIELSFEFFGLITVGYTLLVVYNYYRDLKEPQTEEIY